MHGQPYIKSTNSCFIISLLYASTCFEHYCAHHQEVKIVLHSIWYRHTQTSEWSKITKIQFYKYEHIVVKFVVEKFKHKFYFYVLIFIELYFSNFRPLTCFSVMIPDAV